MLLAAIGYGLVAMFAGGISNALLKDSVLRFGPLRSAALRAGISSLALLAFIAATRPAFPWDPMMAGFTVAVSVLGYFPFIFMLEGFREGKVGVVVPITSGWIVVAALFSAAFFGEVYGSPKLLAFALIVAGIVAASVDPREWRSLGRGEGLRGIYFAFAAAILWGIVFPLFKVTSGFFGAAIFAWTIETTVCISAIFHLILKGERVLPERGALRAGWIPFAVAGILTAGYTVSVSEGYQTGEVGIVSALAGSGVVVAVIVATVLHRERLHAAQYLGIALVLLGTVIASII